MHGVMMLQVRGIAMYNTADARCTIYARVQHRPGAALVDDQGDDGDDVSSKLRARNQTDPFNRIVGNMQFRLSDHAPRRFHARTLERGSNQEQLDVPLSIG